MNYDSTGYIEFRTLLANGALPASGVNIRIKGAEEGNIGVDYSIITDEDGLSETIPLPAPSRNYSLAPLPAEQVYAGYEVEIYKDGYYGKRITNVSIFDGVKSVLAIELVPDSRGEHLSAPINRDTIIEENEDLI